MNSLPDSQPTWALLTLALPILLSIIFSFAIGIVMIIGGLKMMRLQSHGLATTASILALLPCSPAGIIGLIVGIWSLVVLSRPGVKAAFQGSRPFLPPHAAASAAHRRQNWVGCLVAIIVLGIIGLLYVAVRYMRGHSHQGSQAVRTIKSAEIEPNRGPSSGWTLGPNGPRLTDEFARLALKLQPAQIEEVNKILQTTYREYLPIEAEHTEQYTDDLGHLIVRIKPIPGSIAKLEDSLWSQLDKTLNAEQQSIARFNLKLDAPKFQPGMSPSDLDQPGFFGWGKEGASIELWRVGSWYHWDVQSRGLAHSLRGPQLPEVYRRFWKEPATAPAEATKKTEQE